MSWEATAFSKKTRGHPNMSTRAVLLTLSDYHNHTLGYAFCSQATLADDCECSVRNIRAALAFLEKAGWITLAQKGNQHQPSHWVYNFDAAPIYEPEVNGQVAGKIEQAKSAPAEKEVEPQRKVKRQSSASEAEAPRHTNPKEPPPNRHYYSLARTLMEELERIRGYPSGLKSAEEKAIREMFEQGYSGANIIDCYVWKKKDPWWKEQPLTMMSVKKAIGEWKKHSQPVEAPGAKYARDAERLANRPVARSK